MKKKILVVDDDPAIREVLLHGFQEEYEVSAAPDGEKGLAGAKAFAPDLIFLDMSLPDMTGIDILEALRRQGCRAPVVMLTGNEDLSVIRKALDLGAAQYVTKPFDLDYLKDMARDKLGGPDDKSGRPWRTRK